jgi:hypothetical protein
MEPWKLSVDYKSIYQESKPLRNGKPGPLKTIALIFDGNRAAAMLMAAAPKMLEALKQLKVRFHFMGMPQEAMFEGRPDWRKELKLLEEAIAAATKEDLS